MAQPQSQVPQVPPQMPQMQMPQMPPQLNMPQMPPMAPRPPPPYSPPAQNSPAMSNQAQAQIQAQNQAGYAMNKRPQNSPGAHSQPQSPYLATPYAMSPQATGTPQPAPAAAPSPGYQNLMSPGAVHGYGPPYTNGAATASSPASTPTLHFPEPRPAQPPATASPATSSAPAMAMPSMPPTPAMAMPALPTPPPQQAQQQQSQHQQQQSQQQQQQYTTATMAPISHPPPPPPTPGAMGPPSKPADRPVREYEYDVSDSLAGTGIDLRAEEAYLAELYGGSFAQEAKGAALANVPGSKGSFYGAGPANQPAQPGEGMSQEEFEAEAAKRAWDEAAQRLAVTRSNEMKDPFLELFVMHYRADKIAKEHGLELNLDSKTGNSMGRFKHPHDFPQPKVTVVTRPGPDGVVVTTTGSWIPQDAFLADQLALLSIATKHRLKSLIEDADEVAKVRQTTSHGEIPPEWADVAVPLRTGLDSLPMGPDGAATAKSLKRSFEEFASHKSAGGKHGLRNLTEAVRDGAKVDREQEEARLRKRQKRLNPEAAQAGGSRAGSAAPGTPGAAAPEETKAPSKKELKKGAAAARLAEASSTANANQTLSTLMSGFGGKKKKGKTYSWMTSGASGASTPRGGLGSLDAGPGSPAASGGAVKPQDLMLTPEPKTRMGTWREDKEKGKGIQLRDWVTVLEKDGRDPRAVQVAYAKLDTSTPR